METTNKMIQASDLLPMLFKAYPELREELLETVSSWLPRSGNISPHTIMTHLSHRVAKNFMVHNYTDSEELFDLVELLIIDGSEDVKNAVCTCFLANLQNIASNENEFDDSHYVSLLRAKSIEFCKYWDEYTGVKTDGLW